MASGILFLSVVVSAAASACPECESPGGIMLLQKSAEVLSSHSTGVGSAVPLTEKGYQVVADVKSDSEMKDFVLRVLEKEARYARDVAELSGLVPFYSGTQNVQSLESLKKELRDAPWVADGEGRSAALNEDGYQKVAKRKSKPHMMAYARRILDDSFKKSSDEGALIGLVPYFDGEISVQSFGQLRSELLSAPWAVPRDSEQILVGSAPRLSLSEQQFWPFTDSHETAAQDEKVELKVSAKELPEPEDAVTATTKETQVSKVEKIKETKIDNLKKIKEQQMAKIKEAQASNPEAINATKVKEAKAEKNKAMQISKDEAHKESKVAKIQTIKDAQVEKVKATKAGDAVDVNATKVGETKAADAARIEETKEADAENTAATKAEKTKQVQVEKVEDEQNAKVAKVKEIKDSQISKVDATKVGNPDADGAKVSAAKVADAAKIDVIKNAQADETKMGNAQKTKDVQVQKVEDAQDRKVSKDKEIKKAQVAEVAATKAADGVEVNSAMVGEIKALNDARIAKIKSEKAAKIEEIKQEKASGVEGFEPEDVQADEPMADDEEEAPQDMDRNVERQGAPKAQRVRKHTADPELADGWSYVSLDDKEVAERGSYCIDGSTPGYFYKPGTIDDKWIIAIEGGKMFCEDEDVCVQMLGNDFASADSMVYLKLFETDEFKEYNMVELHHCDGGMFMSDRADPLVHNGNKMYFRGKRIIDHVFDTLKENKTFASATEVLITGGSGGGQATTVLADYLAGLMPASVHKVGAVPMSGWYTSDWNDIEYTFGMHEMSGTIAPGCRDALDESEQYKCLDPRVSYEHSQTPMFVVQLLDSQSLAGAYAENTTLAETSRVAWTNCMETSTSACSDSDRSVLQGYLDELVAGIQGGTKHAQQGEGGFLSTCTKHVFYKEDEYDHYADNGNTIADAVATWWRNLGTAGAKWFLPCTLNTKGEAQCESSCAYDSGSTE